MRVPRPLQKGFLSVFSGSPDTPRLGKSPGAEARARLPSVPPATKRALSQSRPRLATRASGKEGSGAVGVAAGTPVPKEVTSGSALPPRPCKKLPDWVVSAESRLWSASAGAWPGGARRRPPRWVSCCG